MQYCNLRQKKKFIFIPISNTISMLATTTHCNIHDLQLNAFFMAPAQMKEF